jgi:hypothetical protein
MRLSLIDEPDILIPTFTDELFRSGILATAITRINISSPPPHSSTTIAATMSQLAEKSPSEEINPLSPQPTELPGLGLHVTRATIAPGTPRGSGTATPSTVPALSTRESILAAHLDITPSLRKAIHSVVKARNGSVLSRGSILKTDHYPSGECSKLFGGQESRRGFIGQSPTLRDQR